MPFKSEKQRRFLWAERPEIAKRWAHEYPKSNKNLPMYADTKKEDSAEKEAALGALERALGAISPQSVLINSGVKAAQSVKSAESDRVKVDIPHSDKPTYAGEEREHGALDEEGNPKSEGECAHTGDKAISAIFGKLSAVLAQPLRKMMEAQQALEEDRDTRYVPQNLGVRRYTLPSAVVPPPLGMVPPPAQTPAPSSTPQVAQQPGNSQPVGGGSNPQHNPIQAFGPLGAKGQLNGNAAFGIKNSPDSLKTAGDSPAWQRSEGKNPEGGLNEKGRKSYERESGGNLKAPVTESNPSGERAKRQNSFCSRMCGMKRVNTGASTAKDPDSRINKSLRKWNCKCSSAYEFGEKMAGLATALSRGTMRTVERHNDDVRQENVEHADDPGYEPQEEISDSAGGSLALLGGLSLLLAPRLLGMGGAPKSSRR